MVVILLYDQAKKLKQNMTVMTGNNEYTHMELMKQFQFVGSSCLTKILHLNFKPNLVIKYIMYMNVYVFK